MKRFAFAMAVLVVISPSMAQSQTALPTTTPKTKLEAFEAQDGVVIIQGFSRIGELKGVYGGSVAVLAKEFTHATTGKKESGIAIDVKEGGRLERSSRSFIDYDEIPTLLKGIDYIGKADKSVTKLDNFQADYKTKGDFKVSTFSASEGGLMVAVASGRIGPTSVHLKFAELNAFSALISGAKARLDTAK